MDRVFYVEVDLEAIIVIVDLGVLNQRRGRGSERREAYSIPEAGIAGRRQLL